MLLHYQRIAIFCPAKSRTKKLVSQSPNDFKSREGEHLLEKAIVNNFEPGAHQAVDSVSRQCKVCEEDPSGTELDVGPR